MKLLVVGAAGYVGSIVRPALEAAYDCWYYDLKPVPDRAERCFVGSVEDHALVDRALGGVDTVLYMPMGVGRGGMHDVNSIGPAFSVNAAGTYRFAYLAMMRGIRRFIYISTLSVYHGDYGRFDVAEDHPPNGLYPYAITKRLGEFACTAMAQGHPDATFVMLRLYHPRNESDFNHPISTKDHPTPRFTCSTGPKDTQRLFVAAAAFDEPGAHIIQATGDLSGTVFNHGRAKRLLGWEPRGE